MARNVFFVVLFTYLATTLSSFLLPAQPFLKPVIVGSLIWLVVLQTFQNKEIRTILLAGLGFSLAGDILLIFADDNLLFFIGGLISFLIAHILYISIFYKEIDFSQINRKRSFSIIGLLFLFAFTFLTITGASFGELLLPVICYMIAILSMAFMAFMRWDQVLPSSYLQVLYGAILFLVSDTLLAINKFYAPIIYSGFFIMLTYSLAQYFIVSGIIFQQTEKVKILPGKQLKAQ